MRKDEEGEEEEEEEEEDEEGKEEEEEEGAQKEKVWKGKGDHQEGPQKSGRGRVVNF